MSLNRKLALALLLFGAGCADPMTAKIIAVNCRNEMVFRDCETVVQFEDSTRAMKSGVYGEVGDKFKAYKDGFGSWR